MIRRYRFTLCLFLLVRVLVVSSTWAQGHSKVYVSDMGGSRNAYAIDPATNTVAATIPLDTATPQKMAAAPDGKLVYVTMFETDSVLIIDTSADTVVHTIHLPLGSGPVGVALTPDGSYVYVTLDYPGAVAVINAATRHVEPQITVGAGPQSVAFTPDGQFAYVGNSWSVPNGNSVSVIRTVTRSVVATIPVGNTPQEVAITPNGAFVYVANYYSYDVSVISTASNSVVGTVSVASSPVNLAVTPNGAYVYVPLVGGQVAVISTATNTVGATISTGNHPATVAFTPDSATGYVSNFDSANVSAISTATNTVGTNISVGVHPYGLAIATPRYLTCALYDQTKAARSGATVSIRIQLCDANGVNLSAASVTVTATGVTQLSNSAPGNLQDSGNSNPDNNFRYDAGIGGSGGYVFNLSTKGYATGTYSLSFVAGSDPSTHTVQFQVK